MSAPRQVEFRREVLPPLTALEHEWHRLEAVGRTSFFTSWHWIGTLLATVPPARRPELLRGVVRGETVALALLGANNSRRRYGLVRSRSLHLNETGDSRFDSLTIEHNGLLAASEFEPVILESLTTWFADRCDEADELYFAGSQLRLPESAIEGSGLLRSEIIVPSFSVDLCRLEQNGGEIFSILSANTRQQLRRAFRHYEQFGPLQLREAETEGEAQRFFTAMKALHSASWERRGRSHSFAAPFFELFHRRLIKHSFEKGAMQLLRASAGDRVIGYLYNFRLSNRIYAYQSGFDDADRRERPGFVTHALAIRHAFRSGARVYDFMAGRNRLKESYATRSEPMLWQVVQQPRFAFQMENLARRLKCSLSKGRESGA